ncbi:hypothetical protein BB561_005291 [Smittium simulii]|uniref:Uncharacterized protein n=1 Tax=Smittium simulii TaxID=133385 RepID=A0A2T9YB81_9FUNG|nr:hypothetical protein BB561_005291 [Smittium simulii]
MGDIQNCNFLNFTSANPFYAIETSIPNTFEGLSAFRNSLDILTSLNTSYVGLNWNPPDSTFSNSTDLAAEIKDDYNVQPQLRIHYNNMTRNEIDDALKASLVAFI